MCACAPGFTCSRCQGTRRADDYQDTDDHEQPEPEQARPSEYEVRDA
jgi:hypothetical protein